jgi:hypothetical protein
LSTDRKLVWHRQDPEQGHATLVEQGKLYETRNQKRKTEAVKLMRLYEGDTITGFDRGLGMAESTSDDVRLMGEPVDITLNLAQSLVDTLDAKIAGLENTKPQITTVEASWDVRRRAKNADRFIEGQFYERQGRFQDLWDVFRFALRLALASTQTAAVKFIANERAGKIQAEVHDTLNMWVDCPGSIYDYPSGMGHTSYWDPEKLLEVYGEKYPGTGVSMADDVYAASSPMTRKSLGLELFSEDQDTRSNELRRVPVTCGWRFKCYDKPGVYCSSFPGAKHPLAWKPYDNEDPPFVFVGGQKSLTSFWHRTLIKPIVAPILRVNEILGSIDRSERLTPKGVIFYDPEEVPKELLAVGDDHECIPIAGLSGMKGKPIYEAPAPFHPLALDLVKFYIEQCYGLPGISELHAAADVKGDWSGAALRIRKQLINERFATIQRAYVQASTVEASKQIIRCAREMAEVNPDFGSTWRGAGFMKEIGVETLRVLDKHKYDVGVYAVSESKHSPESELALSQELLSVGIVTGDAYLQTLQYFNALQGAKSNNDAQERLIGIQIDKWLMADRREMRARNFYRGPIPTMDLFAAVIQVNRATLNAMADEVDDVRIQVFNRYLKDLQKLITNSKTQAAGQMQAAGGNAAAAGALQAAPNLGAPSPAPASMPAPMAA